MFHFIFEVILLKNENTSSVQNTSYISVVQFYDHMGREGDGEIEIVASDLICFKCAQIYF